MHPRRACADQFASSAKDKGNEHEAPRFLISRTRTGKQNHKHITYHVNIGSILNAPQVCMHSVDGGMHDDLEVLTAEPCIV